MRISEVSEQSGLSVDTLRYYEKIGLLSPVNRTKSGIRDYNELDLKRIDFIKCMRRSGLPIEVLLEYFALVEQGDETIEARKTILQEQRTQLVAKMAEMQETLNLLEQKIQGYETAVLMAEQALTIGANNVETTQNMMERVSQ
ncbi:MAG: MerR family transcriptional regulator [Anaerolineales bacterium]|nr:MerR family transcriptional regulator [Anaerolineales bacterium]